MTRVNIIFSSDYSKGIQLQFFFVRASVVSYDAFVLFSSLLFAEGCACGYGMSWESTLVFLPTLLLL